MALALDITDNKGVKTRYHAIRSFEYKDGRLSVKLYSYVNQATRDSEKIASSQNAQAQAYEDNLQALRSELDSLIGKTDEESVARVSELSEQINTLTLDPERPNFVEVVDTHYAEDEVKLDYFEPITTEALYNKISASGRYSGATSV